MDPPSITIRPDDPLWQLELSLGIVLVSMEVSKLLLLFNDNWDDDGSSFWVVRWDKLDILGSVEEEEEDNDEAVIDFILLVNDILLLVLEQNKKDDVDDDDCFDNDFDNEKFGWRVDDDDKEEDEQQQKQHHEEINKVNTNVDATFRCRFGSRIEEDTKSGDEDRFVDITL